MKRTLRPLVLDNKACYAALKAHDARFDGCFFVGVSSTGIYCRPICRVKVPKEENCSFYISAAAAEAAGYRPCLKCRPELAPGQSLMDATARIARQAASVIEEEALAGNGIAGLARTLGVTDRHLRRVFAVAYGVSPVQYLQTCKLLLAKSLLADTTLPITEVAFAAGFGSLRRFNDLFRKQYRLTPGDLRKSRKRIQGTGGNAITVLLGYRHPYKWGELVSFLAERAIPGVESASDTRYRRTVSMQNGQTTIHGWISVADAPQKNALAVTLSPALLPVLPKVLSRLKILFDLSCDPAAVFETLSSMNDRQIGLFTPGTRLPGCFDPYELSVRAVLGQQITVKAARTLATRFVCAFGEAVVTPFEELSRTFPTPETIYGLAVPVENRLGPLGITGARARSIFALSEALVKGHISFSRSADPAVTMEKLRELPGFGPWTVQYIAMRALAWPDAFPHTDYGIRKALAGMSADEIVTLSESWRPWRSYAAVSLWNSPANQTLTKS
jgi:AraC family transcriptional regulator of adaptative response / DNA-3-methyladenine glycosylase II